MLDCFNGEGGREVADAMCAETRSLIVVDTGREKRRGVVPVAWVEEETSSTLVLMGDFSVLVT